mmetsp:Transcript_27624/g.74456  ORF Transcript_27624/g.74456 Transcript_27624/m.74456 type:complete len:129 (-) Transcript_27624:3-389(-)
MASSSCIIVGSVDLDAAEIARIRCQPVSHETTAGRLSRAVGRCGRKARDCEFQHLQASLSKGRTLIKTAEPALCLAANAHRRIVLPLRRVQSCDFMRGPFHGIHHVKRAFMQRLLTAHWLSWAMHHPL